VGIDPATSYSADVVPRVLRHGDDDGAVDRYTYEDTESTPVISLTSQPHPLLSLLHRQENRMLFGLKSQLTLMGGAQTPISV